MRWPASGAEANCPVDAIGFNGHKTKKKNSQETNVAHCTVCDKSN